MRLYVTPLSHFSRKVRILLAHYGAEVDLIDVGDVSLQDPSQFGGNPLMEVPVLVDGETWLNDSDVIALYVVSRLDPGDRYRVRAAEPALLVARAIMNGIMRADVDFVLAERTGLPTVQFAFFRKVRRVIENGLAWLESRVDEFGGDAPGYREFHLACMWEHLQHYGTVPLEYPRLAQLVSSVAHDERVLASSPHRVPGRGPGRSE